MLPPINKRAATYKGSHIPRRLVLSPNVIPSTRTPPHTVWALTDTLTGVGCTAGSNILLAFPITDATPQPAGPVVGIAKGKHMFDHFVATPAAIYGVTIAGRWALLWPAPPGVNITLFGSAVNRWFVYDRVTGKTYVLRATRHALTCVATLRPRVLLGLSTNGPSRTLYALQKEPLCVLSYRYTAEERESAGIPRTLYVVGCSLLGLQTSRNVQIVRSGTCIVFTGTSGGKPCIAKAHLSSDRHVFIYYVMWSKPWDSFVALEDCIMVYTCMDGKTTRVPFYP